MENAESIEQMLKPTRKRRGILLILFFVLASIQVASSLQIQYAADAYNVRKLDHAVDHRFNELLLCLHSGILLANCDHHQVGYVAA